MTLQPGDILGEYRVLDAIGAGGMGAVYKVEHLITRRVEAMKTFSASIGVSPAEIDRFESEIRMQARLSHPNIAAVYSAVRHGDTLALVMEYVEGESLAVRLARERLSIDAAAAILSDVLAALACAHRNGVIHRDVSPSNILIAASGAKLTDFGLACDRSLAPHSGTGIPVGTAWYMSPEQVRGMGVDARSDLYGAGVVLHEILAGRKLFDADGAFAVMQCHVETVPDPTSRFNPRVPPELDRVVAKALAKAPPARFQTAEEFRAALAAAVGARRSAYLRRRRLSLQFAAVGLVACASAGIIRIDRRAAPAPVRAVPPRPQSPSPSIAVAPSPVLPEEAPAARKPAAVATHPPSPDDALKPYTIRSSDRHTGSASSAPAPQTRTAALPATSVPVVPPETDAPAPPTIAKPAAVAAPALPLAQPEPPAPPRSGNWFVKAVGKLNPFRRADKPDAAPNAAPNPQK